MPHLSYNMRTIGEVSGATADALYDLLVSSAMIGDELKKSADDPGSIIPPAG
jgi:hypothetical protein